MAKRQRRRVIVLESDEEEDGANPDDKGHAARTASVHERGGKSANSPKKKKLSHQPTLSILLENKRGSSKKGSYGRLPLQFVTKSDAKPPTSVCVNDGRATDRKKPNLYKPLDDRLWVEKYSPKSVGELVVHSKKVAEVKDWLQGQLSNPYGESQTTTSRVLVLTGPPGVGKTAVVHVLAELLKIELLEWSTPAPELWHEYSHHAASGAGYVSKLDEFEAFLERGRNTSSLPIVSVAPSTAMHLRGISGDKKVKKDGAKVLFIDDVPFVNHKDQRERLARSFYHLALSRNFPTIVVHTDDEGGGELGVMHFQHKVVLSSLERGGAKKIAFNPVTVNSMKKLLSKVQLSENCRISSESLSVIAESSAGDIRQALTSLQFLSLGCQSQPPYHLMWDPGGRTQIDPLMMRTLNDAEGVDIKIDRSSTEVCGRDYSISLFHALGKFLHNKRHSEDIVNSATETRVRLKEVFRRYPLNMDEPEVVLSQSHTDTPTVLAFLHENVLQFIDEEAIDDVAAVASYFSDTDCLLGAHGNFSSRNSLINANDIGPSQVAAAAASSVAARGVLFGNAHPAPSRWHSLRSPAVWQVDRQQKQKKAEILTGSVRSLLLTRTLSRCIQATELYPFYKKLSHHCVPFTFLEELPKSGKGILPVASMELDTGDQSVLLEVDEGTDNRNLNFETTFLHMSVEDDIQDEEE